MLSSLCVMSIDTAKSADTYKQYSYKKIFPVYLEINCQATLYFQVLLSQFVFSHYVCAIVRVRSVSCFIH